MASSDSAVISEQANINNSSNASADNHEGQTSEAVVDIHARQRIFKIIVIGDTNVGKTCLTYRFCSGRFPEKSEATIGVDFREKNVIVGGTSLKLQIWDTAGQERFRKSMVQHYYRNVHAVVFVYDVTKQATFSNLTSWIEECDANNLNENVPRILVGNKCDLQNDIVVSTNAAQCFADAHGMPLFETSAKDGSHADHVESIFLTIAHKLKNSRPMMTSDVRSVGSVSGASGRSIQVGRQRSSERQQSVCPCSL